MNVSVNSGDLEIRVDRRTELLGIIQIISNYTKYFPEESKRHGNKKYVKEIEEKFGKFRNHETILLFNELLNDKRCESDIPIGL